MLIYNMQKISEQIQTFLDAMSKEEIELTMRYDIAFLKDTISIMNRLENVRTVLKKHSDIN